MPRLWTRTSLTTGRSSAICARKIPLPRNMFRERWWATATWMIMVRGRKSQPTETFGIQTMLMQIGLLTAMDIGTGLDRGDGRGLIIRRGDLHRFTTAAGSMVVGAGVGARARFTRVRTTAPRSSVSLADSMLDLDSGLESASVWGGSRWVGESVTVPGITQVDATGTTSTYTIRIFATSTPSIEPTTIMPTHITPTR